MATTVSMGQMRFAGTSQCYSTIGTKDVGGSDTGQSSIDYTITNSSVDGGVNSGFVDLAIKSPSPFDVDTDYYLWIDLPQDVNYDMTFTIKLVPSGSTNTTAYQYLKEFEVPKSASHDSSLNHSVVLYATNPEASESAVSAMIPIEFSGSAVEGTASEGKIYKTKNGLYYVGMSDGTFKFTTKYNATIMSEIWNTERTTARKGLEIVFRPVVANFDTIKIQMSRITEDVLTQFLYDKDDETYGKSDALTSGNTYSGRVVKVPEVGYKLFQLNDLVPTATNSLKSDKKTLKRIGVWSRPGLPMAVNGEEVRVGSSGYYELDAVDVSSLGIVAQGFQDNWTLDYEYNK